MSRMIGLCHRKYLLIYALKPKGDPVSEGIEFPRTLFPKEICSPLGNIVSLSKTVNPVPSNSIS